MAVPCASACVVLVCPLTTNGSTTTKMMMMYRINEEVTKVRFQLHVKAMIIAAQIVPLNSKNVPNRSDIPICRVFDVEVMAVAGAPVGIESIAWMDWANSDCR